MNKKQLNKLEPPLKLTKEEFISPKKENEAIVSQQDKGRVQTVSFT